MARGARAGWWSRSVLLILLVSVGLSDHDDWPAPHRRRGLDRRPCSWARASSSWSAACATWATTSPRYLARATSSARRARRLRAGPAPPLRRPDRRGRRLRSRHGEPDDAAPGRVARAASSTSSPVARRPGSRHATRTTRPTRPARGSFIPWVYGQHRTREPGGEVGRRGPTLPPGNEAASPVHPRSRGRGAVSTGAVQWIGVAGGVLSRISRLPDRSHIPNWYGHVAYLTPMPGAVG